MKIGDKIYCRDTRESKNLKSLKLYIVVDVNEYGNIQVKEQNTGKTLKHYYKPARFEPNQTDTKTPIKSLAKTIDLNKKYKTKEGCLVNLFCLSNSAEFPVVGEWQEKNGQWHNESWALDGKCFGNGAKSEVDLVEFKDRFVVECDSFWLSVYADQSVLLAGKGSNRLNDVIDRDKMREIVDAWNQFG